MTYGGEPDPEDPMGDPEESQSKVIKESSCIPASQQPMGGGRGRVTCGGLPHCGASAAGHR